MDFFKVWTKNNFYYIRYISVYIQPTYFDLIFKSINDINMNRVFLHSVRPQFWKKWGLFTHLDGKVQTVAVKAVTPGGDY